MRCVACGRSLISPAVTIQTKDGALNYGPKCGRSLMVARGIYRTPADRPAIVSRRRVLSAADPAQVDWISTETERA